VDELWNRCRQTLPGFMFVRLDALPSPEAGALERSDESMEPRDLTEEIVARIWADVLDVEPVGVDVNYFDAGGDSLRGVQVIARVEDTSQLERPRRAG
jgi:Phosphopantetheine attachment site